MSSPSLRRQARRLLGALRSGHRAVFLSLLLRLLRPILSPLDRVVSRCCRREPFPGALPPAVLMVGPPRSGSTVIFQVIARVMPCVFPSNLHCALPRTAGCWLARRRRSPASLPLTRSYFAHTSSLYDVDEGNEIVQRLLPEGLGDEGVRRRWIELLHRMRASASAPLVAKNLKAYDRVSRLQRAVPELFVLRLHRRTSEVVASALRAYRELGGFNPVPEALAQIDFGEDPLDFACRQIVEIERVLDREMERLDPARRLSWSYEEFCARPWDHLEQLADALGLDRNTLRKEALPPAGLQASRRTKVTAGEARRIDQIIRALRASPPATSRRSPGMVEARRR